MREYTEEERDLYLAWLDDQWNQPDRHDHYVMALICAVERKFAAKPDEIQPRKLEFKIGRLARLKTEAEQQEDRELHLKWVNDLAKQHSLAALGVSNTTVVTSDKRPDWGTKSDALVMPEWMK